MSSSNVVSISQPTAPPQAPESNVTDILDKARSLKITNSIQYILACGAKLAVDDMIANRHALHDPVCQKAFEAHKAAVAARKSDLDPLEEAKEIYSRAIDRWSKEQERLAVEKAREEEARLQREAEEQREKEVVEAEQAGATVEEVEAIVDRPLYVPPVVQEKAVAQAAVPRVAGIRKRPELWNARLDPKKKQEIAMRELIQFCARDSRFEGLLQLNEQAANALAKSLKTSMAVPGLVVYDKNAV